MSNKMYLICKCPFLNGITEINQLFHGIPIL